MARPPPPLAFVLPLAALLDLGSALALGFHTRRQADTGLLVAPALWLAVSTSLPVAWAGVWVGHRAHLRLAPAAAARIIAATLFIAGAALVARTL